MRRHVLITGGAGFIGSHLTDELLRHGHRVRCLDNLDRQIHPDGRRPAYLHHDVELIVGDVRDPAAVARALDGVDTVFHLAAKVGVGQSMYQIAEYTHVNNLGTAVLLEALVSRRGRQPIDRLIVASSMSIYGEGLYRDADGEHRHMVQRPLEALHAHQWEPLDDRGRPLQPIPTPETKQPDLASVYALDKYDQERMCLITGRAYGLPAVALRFFNVYGPRQALSNPYTGVLAIFASRLLNGKPPLIFEDGRQRRDFVFVRDVAQACRLAMDAPDAPGKVLNIGSGQSDSVSQVAQRIARALNATIEPQITAKHRIGDIRHCFADITEARTTLGYQPTVTLDQGLAECADWLKQQVADDHVGQATAELAARGLTV